MQNCTTNRWERIVVLKKKKIRPISYLWSCENLWSAAFGYILNSRSLVFLFPLSCLNWIKMKEKIKSDPRSAADARYSLPRRAARSSIRELHSQRFRDASFFFNGPPEWGVKIKARSFLRFQVKLKSKCLPKAEWRYPLMAITHHRQNAEIELCASFLHFTSLGNEVK